MVLFSRQRYCPIGVDVGTRSIKLIQFTADQSQLVDAARWDLPQEKLSANEQADQFVQAIQRMREGRSFRGNQVVVCLNERHLILQNIRVAKGDVASLDRAVQQEAAARVPFPIAEAEIRYIEAAEIRQADQVMREVIVLACHRPMLDQTLELIDKAGLIPMAVDVEPLAILRTYQSQFRRDEDRLIRSLIVHVGYSSTLVMIAQNEELLFVKYIDAGGKQLDESVARSLKMSHVEATALRRHNGDRRTDRQDPEITRSIQEATRPVIDRLANELAMCIRYHSVTFRGQPISRWVLGGGEATSQLLETISARLEIKGDLSNPFRSISTPPSRGRIGQWDVATGLALRPVRPI